MRPIAMMLLIQASTRMPGKCAVFVKISGIHWFGPNSVEAVRRHAEDQDEEAGAERLRDTFR